MKKIALLSLLLAAVMLVLCGCQTASEPEHFQVVSAATQAPQAASATAVPAVVNAGAFTDSSDEAEINYDDGDYDPESEEDSGTDEVIDLTEATAAPTVNSEYAGATPVVVDPIDKPTATPVPEISFTFQNYDATNIHISFSGPVGWTEDTSVENAYTLVNPDDRTGYQAFLTITATPVSSSYSKNDLTKEVKNMLSTIKTGLKNWSPSNTAERTLMDKSGIYANYTATTADGCEIAGRVHVTYINGVVYAVHVSYPRAYRDTYVESVYKQLRSTMLITQ